MTADSLISGIIRAKQKGYLTEFRFEENQLIDRQSHKGYKSPDCKLIKYERFEGMSDPADSSVLFWIECIDGNKGYISSAYGIYANDHLIKFMKTINR